MVIKRCRSSSKRNNKENMSLWLKLRAIINLYSMKIYNSLFIRHILWNYEQCTWFIFHNYFINFCQSIFLRKFRQSCKIILIFVIILEYEVINQITTESIFSIYNLWKIMMNWSSKFHFPWSSIYFQYFFIC